MIFGIFANNEKQFALYIFWMNFIRYHLYI